MVFTCGNPLLGAQTRADAVVVGELPALLSKAVPSANMAAGPEAGLKSA
jgi:hypothetical protein